VYARGVRLPEELDLLAVEAIVAADAGANHTLISMNHDACEELRGHGVHGRDTAISKHVHGKVFVLGE